MSEYRIPSTPEAREAVRQIRLDEHRRIASHLREISQDALFPPSDLFQAFVERHPNYIGERLKTVIMSTLMAVADEIENPDAPQPEPTGQADLLETEDDD